MNRIATAGFTPTDLVGRWSLDRVIHDHRESTELRVTGVADFTVLDSGRIDWAESGTLHLPTGDVPIRATRLLRRDERGGWTTDFADGREFHPWDVGGEVIHDCAPDVYTGRIEAVGVNVADGWTMRWSVSGPAKDYVIESSYTR